MSPLQIDYRRTWRWDAAARRSKRNTTPLRRVPVVRTDGSKLDVLIRGTTILSAKLRICQMTGVEPCNMKVVWDFRRFDDSEAIPPGVGPGRPLRLLVRTPRHSLR